MSDLQKKRRSLSGIVVSDKMTKSIVVKTEIMVRHKLYGKELRRHKKYIANDPDESCSVGDIVIIEETRPLSKHKRWRLREIVEKAA